MLIELAIGDAYGAEFEYAFDPVIIGLTIVNTFHRDPWESSISRFQGPLIMGYKLLFRAG